MASINLQKTINKDAKTIFRFLTEQDLLMQWYAPQAIALPIKGTVIAFAFDSDINFKMKIVELKEFEALKWVCVDGNVDWLESAVSLTIKKTGPHKCVLRFRHSKLNNKEKIDNWRISWGSYLNILKKKCESFE